jgi:hypothetical protein
MTLRLDSDPLTPTQLGAVHGEFRRLGFGRADRAERLAATAVLARVPAGLESTVELTAGEAGRVIRALRECASYADLAARLRQAGPEPRMVTLAEAIRFAIAAILRAAGRI